MRLACQPRSSWRWIIGDRREGVGDDRSMTMEFFVGAEEEDGDDPPPEMEFFVVRGAVMNSSEMRIRWRWGRRGGNGSQRSPMVSRGRRRSGPWIVPSAKGNRQRALDRRHFSDGRRSMRWLRDLDGGCRFVKGEEYGGWLTDLVHL